MFFGGPMPSPAPRGFAVGGSPTALPAPVAQEQPVNSAKANEHLQQLLADMTSALSRIRAIDDRGLFTMFKTAQDKYGRM